jgi:hypothetical protein
MNLNQIGDTNQTVIETSNTDDIFDEALDRTSWNGTDYGPPSTAWCKGKEKLPR